MTACASTRRWRFGSWIALVVLIAVTCARASDAHEIGTTRVSVVFHDSGTYDIVIVTDAASLADKLAAVSGKASPVVRGAAELQPLLKGDDAVFQQRLHVGFDGDDVHPHATYGVASPADALTGPVATVRLSGPIPAGAHRFTWRYGWTFASYAITVRQSATDAGATEWLEGDQGSTPWTLQRAAPQPPRPSEIVKRYLVLGFTHIVPLGLDHVLFVLGIYLLAGRMRAVLSQVTAFTIAHSMTLGLSMYGLVSVRPAVVEPLIAISIAYVAIENICVANLTRWRVAIVFGFGLLHGLGFAGALRDLGLPRTQFATALVAFNAGVEGGQLAVIAAAFVVVGWYCAGRSWYRRRIVIPASAAIACAALYWTAERLSL